MNQAADIIIIASQKWHEHPAVVALHQQCKAWLCLGYHGSALTLCILPTCTQLVSAHIVFSAQLSQGMCLAMQVVQGLAASVGIMQAALPVLQALHNKSIKDRHWTKLAGIMGTPLAVDPPLTLAQLLDLKVNNAAQLSSMNLCSLCWLPADCMLRAILLTLSSALHV